MRHVISDRINDLKAFHHRDVELVSITRNDRRLEEIGGAILSARKDVDASWIQSSACVAPAIDALAATLEAADAAVIAEEIAAATAALEDLLGAPSASVRMHSLRRPMCPLFHVDQIRCRMLITLAGPGTQWLASSLDKARVDDAEFQGTPKQLDTGSWSLLKGGLWDASFDGVLHRSPPGEEQRLLIAMDPLAP